MSELALLAHVRQDPHEIEGNPCFIAMAKDGLRLGSERDYLHGNR